MHVYLAGIVVKRYGESEGVFVGVGSKLAAMNCRYLLASYRAVPVYTPPVGAGVEGWQGSGPRVAADGVLLLGKGRVDQGLGRSPTQSLCGCISEGITHGSAWGLTMQTLPARQLPPNALSQRECWHSPSILWIMRWHWVAQ